jgi:hypothetical protein
LDKTSFTCGNIGANTVTLTITDNSGNSSKATATVNVVDNVKPTVVTRNITVQLNAQGALTISPADINNGSFDNCDIASLTVDKTSFSCSNVGANTVTLTARDVNGNEASATATVTVEDKVTPTVITKNISVVLSNGVATITPEHIDNGSSDACGIASLTLNKTSFDCTNLGANSVTLTVTDKNGNTDSKTATVTVVGMIPAPSITVSRTNAVYTGAGTENTIFLGYGAQSLGLTATNGTSTQNNTQYSWSPASFLSATQGATVTYAPDAAAVGERTIIVTATNEYGCVQRNKIVIKVVDVRCGPTLKNVQICHASHNNLLHENNICIDASAVDAHLKAGCTLDECNQLTTRAASTIVRGATGKAFAINVAPNPSTTRFRIAVEGSEDKLAVLKVFDMKGRLVEIKRNIRINSVVEVGVNYRPGVYIAEVTQGSESKQLRLVKIAD